MSHVCLLSRSNKLCLFSGDTLFNAGVGNCHNGGNANSLYETYRDILFNLDDKTLLYPGHDYIENNINFTIHLEPNNQYALDLLNQVSNQNPNNAFTSSIGIEKKINTFFRLENQSIIKNLISTKPDLKKQINKKNVFLALRELRNKW